MFTNAAGGFWDDPNNWDTKQVPGANDDVMIDLPAGAAVTFRQGTATIKSLKSNNPFTLSGGTLTVSGNVQANATFTLSGGTLANATILPGTAGQGLALTNSGGTLSRVTIETGAKIDGTQLNASYPANYDVVNVTGGLTLNGTLNLGRPDGSTYGQINFLGSQTLGGTGTVAFGGSTSNAVYERTGETGTLTLASGVAVQVVAGYVGGAGSYGASESVTNQGAISVTGNLSLGGVGWANAGAISGKSITASTSFTNSGTLITGGNATAGSFTITGSFTQTSTGVLNVDLGGVAAGTQFDQLAVSGAATLGGTINVFLIGGFVPAIGSSFQFLTYASRAGTFAAVVDANVHDTTGFDAAYNAANAVVTAKTVAAQ